MNNTSVALCVFAVVLKFAAAPSLRSQTNSLVVPSEVANSFAPGGGDNPFASSSFWQIYAPTEFAGAPSDAILITEVAFRPDEGEQNGFQAVFHTLGVDMAQYTGTVAQAVIDIRGFQTTAFSNVLAAKNFTMSVGPAIGPSDFSIRFPLKAPFVYDRRRGPLALRFSGDRTFDRFTAFDGVTFFVVPGEPASGLDFSFRRGAFVEQLADGHFNGGAPELFVTQFSVLPLAVTLDRVNVAGSNVDLDYTATPAASALRLKLESTESFSDSFVTDTNAVFSTPTNTKGHVRTVSPGRILFYRIRIY